MADDESRAARQKALAEKKRRLEEIKARRRQPAAAGGAGAGVGGGGGANAAAAASSSSANANNLDSYIDDLLKTSAPGLNLPPTATEAVEEAAPTTAAGGEEKAGDKAADQKEDGEGKATYAETTPTAPTAAAPATPARPTVETFEIAIQCEEDDFPPPSLIDEDEKEETSSNGSASDNDDDDDEGGETGADDLNKQLLQRVTSYESHSDNKRHYASSKAMIEPLSEEEKSKMLSSQPFTQFLSTASKRVERLLGASEESMYGILNGSGWGGAGAGGVGTGSGGVGVGGVAADFSTDYANEEEEEDYYDSDNDDTLADGVGTTATGARKKKRKSKKTQEEAYQTGGYFLARATYEFPKFTQGRNVTDMEWCPGHKEWVLASYNSVSSGGGASGGGFRGGEAAGGGGGDGSGMGMGSSIGGIPSHNPSTRHLSPHDPSSSFLQPSSSSSSTSAIPNEGIVAIYNLSMPHRPEHVFCAGCPILHSQFHPTEHPKLILGGGSSGQVLVWDARVGRYPVQRSSALGGGHDCELVGMKVLGDESATIGGSGAGGGGAAGGITTSKLVTASSDGKINYWSVSNLREPVEHVNVKANLSCLEVLHGSNNEGVVCGDEMGGLHVILAGTGRDGSSSNKRVVRTLHPGGVMGDSSASVAGGSMEDTDPDAAALQELSQLGHYGMVTSVATRPVMPTLNTPRGSNKETTTSSSLGGGMSAKGFLRGAGGLMVTTGVDWSTKLWAPAYSDKPLMSFLSSSYDYMCDAQWSPVHPSIFATSSSNGTLNIWNLASTLDEPVSGTEGIHIDAAGTGGGADSTTTRQGLNRIQWSSDGRRMAVASGDKLHVLGVGEEVWKSKGDEEGRVMNNLVSRGLIQQD